MIEDINELSVKPEVGNSTKPLFFIFFTNILKIIVFLFGSTKISRIFVKELRKSY